MVYLNCLFLLDSDLADCVLLEICPFLLDCPVCWRIPIRSIFLRVFWISVVLVAIYHFSLLIYLSPLSFLLGEPGYRFINFIFQKQKKHKKTALVFIWSFLLFLLSPYFLSDFYYFLPFADFGLCSFSYSLLSFLLRWLVRLFEISSFSRGRPLSLWTFL